MANNGIYANERPSSGAEADFNSDPTSGGFFASDLRKHEDLKNMLDSNKDGLKLEAMKRIIGMVAKGKDASDLFPAVVKNVVSKKIEVKKLVYVYLVRYAEEQQDLALLSISTFQRALKDPNQLIRASALRVLSSIRVPVIVPIMMLSIKDAVTDMSPYVRKTAAHAIPKLYSLDPEQKDQLIDVIEKLLADKTTLVVGSAVMAFEEVCPERIDLIHKNYRKLCNLLVDVEEWGQVVIINMLTRYARTQFVDPNKNCTTDSVDDKTFYDSDTDNKTSTKTQVMDPDHRLLLRVCKPLLQSRNASVVMSVAQLYYYLAPFSEVNIITKALIRLLHNHREIQSVVLSNIATMSTKHKKNIGMFEPYLRSFFVRSSDPTHIKLLKLEVLTNLATETNVSIILREFQTYVSSSDMEFVAATIQAIGRCASSIAEVTDTCLSGLVSLLSNRNEAVVAESVVVIKKLLQMQPSEHKDIIVHMARLVDVITVPMARASILWLLGEYADRVPKIAPDVLRKVAKTFVSEEDIVKLQTLSLAAKLYLLNAKQTKLLTQYVFNLAKYDQNYDIRDRARFLRQLIMPQGEKGLQLAKYAKKILLVSKPAPLLQSKFIDRDEYQLGSLSHYINVRAAGYHDIPSFPDQAPDPGVRNVEVAMPWQDSRIAKKKKQVLKKKSFYSETESSSASEELESSESESETSNASSKDDRSETSDLPSVEDESGDKSSSASDDSDEPASDDPSSDDGKKKGWRTKSERRGRQYSSSPRESSDSDGSESSSRSRDEKTPRVKAKPQPKKLTKENLNLLLDLDDFCAPAVTTQVVHPSASVPLLTPNTGSVGKSSVSESGITAVSLPMHIPTQKHELLNRYHGNGLTVTYRFTRSPNIYSPRMTSVELTIHNSGSEAVSGVHVPDAKSGGIEVKGFPAIGTLAVDSSVSATLGIDYNESTQPASFELRTGKQNFSLNIKAPVGEILQPVLLTEGDFILRQGKLKGMNENTANVDQINGTVDSKSLVSRMFEVANVMQTSGTEATPDTLRFAAQTLGSKSLVLITLQSLNNGKVSITVNCEKMIVGSMLLKELREALVK